MGPQLHDAWLHDLYLAHRDTVFRYAASWGSRDYALDVVSETFVLALRQRNQFDPSRGTSRAWLLGIATNVLHDQRRRARSDARLAQRIQAIASPEPAQDFATTMVDTLTDGEHTQRLREAIDQLPASEREAFLLHALGNPAPQEVAQALGIRRNAATVRIHRARHKLRNILTATYVHGA